MQRYFILRFMNHFHWLRFKDYLHYYLFQPHRGGRKIGNVFIRDFIQHVLLASKNRNLEKLELVRKRYLKDQTIINIDDYGAGSMVNKRRLRKISEIAKVSASSKRKSAFLNSLVSYYRPQTIIELGTSLGIGAMSLSLANNKSKIYTLEGSAELLEIANESFKELGINNIETVCGRFDEQLPQLLNKLKWVDLFFIDGNHTYEATIRYYQMALKHSKPGTIIVFDDIRWSGNMLKAWQDICCNKEAKVIVDLLNMGIVFVNAELMGKYFRIYY